MRLTNPCKAATIAGTALAIAALSPAWGQTTMRLASATINDVQHQWQQVFAEELAARVGDAVTTEIYPASQLGTIPRMAEGVLLGTIESFITPTAFLVGTDPVFQIFDSPALFDDAEHAAAVIHDPEYRDHIEEIALDSGIRVIGIIYNSPILILSNDPVETLEDFDGLKVRTFSSPLQMEPMEELGAIPLPLALSEVVPALQSGGVDAMLAGMPILTAFQYYDVASYVTDLNFSTVISVNIVNEAWFQSQPEDVRDAIIESGRVAEQAVLDWGIENVQNANQVWLDNGGEILQLGAEDQAELAATAARVADEILSSNDAVASEYQRLREVAERHSAN